MDASGGIITLYNSTYPDGIDITISGSAAVTVESLCDSKDGCIGINASGTVNLSTVNQISITMGAASDNTYAIVAAKIACPANTTVNNGAFVATNMITASVAGTAVEINCSSDRMLSFSCENGANLPNLKVNSTLELPSLGAWKGYTFDGWYSAPNGEDAETSPAFTGKLTQETARGLTTSCKVYAHWKNNNKTVLTQSLALNEYSINTDKYTSQGYKWEKIDGKNTLTLNGFTMENAFFDIRNVHAIIINGENCIYGKQDQTVAAALILTHDSNGTIELSQGDSSGSLYVAAGSTLDNSVAINVRDGSLRINSGTVTAIGGKGSNSCGILASVVNKDGTVTATGGAADYSYGIRGAVSNLSGTVTATGGAADYSYGIYGTVSNLSGTVTATGGAAKMKSAGICFEGSGAMVTVTGGTIKATGGSSMIPKSESYGIYGNLKDNMNYSVKVLSEGSLEATAGSAVGLSVGVMVNHLSMQDGADFSASCKNSAFYHAAVVYSEGSISDDAAITGSSIKASSACEFTVYSDDSFTKMPLCELVNSAEIIDGNSVDKATALHVKTGAALTIGKDATLALPSISTVINEGSIAHNGIIYLTSESLSGEELASAIAEKGFSGNGLIMSGETMYLCDGSSVADAYYGDITVSNQDNTANPTFYSYDNEKKQLMVNSGKTIVGNIILKNKDTKLLLGDGVTILGNIMYDNVEAGSIVISVPQGKTAVINGDIYYKQLEYGVGLTLCSGILRVNGYVQCDALDIATNSRLEVNYTKNNDSAAVKCNDLTVSCSLIVNNVSGLIGVRAGSALLKQGGTIKVGCRIGLYVTGSEGFTMERGSCFVANTDDVQGIALISSWGRLNLPNDYLPHDCVITTGNLSGNIQTLARSGVSLTTGSTDVTMVQFSAEEYKNIIHDVVISDQSFSGDIVVEYSGEEHELQQLEADKIAGAERESVVITKEQAESDQSLAVEDSDTEQAESDQPLAVEDSDAEQTESDQPLAVEDSDTEQAESGQLLAVEDNDVELAIIPGIIYAVVGSVFLLAVVGVCLYRKRKTKV